MTPEGRVKEKVKRLLKKYNAYYFMPVQTGMGSRSLDFLCCYCGRFFAIETKAEGKEPTPLQEHTIREIEKAGGFCFIIVGTNNPAFETLEGHLKEIKYEHYGYTD